MKQDEIVCYFIFLFRWTLTEIGCYNHYSGITTNIGEGYNFLLKMVTEHKELGADEVAVFLYHLTIFHYNEIVRGFCGKGKFDFNIYIYFLLAFRKAGV